MRGDVARLVALDLVLRLVGAGAAGVALVIEVLAVDLGDRPGDFARFGVP